MGCLIFEAGVFCGVPFCVFFLVFLFYLISFGGDMWSKSFGGTFYGLISHFGMGYVFPGIGFIVFLLIMLVFLNLFGLVPMGISYTSLPSMTMGLAFIMWGGSYIYCFSKNTLGCIAHFVPVGAPVVLCVALIQIEILSWLCRPLGVRLMANITAGHLLLVLMGSGLFSLSGVFQVFGLVLMLLVFLEIGVGFIQGYVYCLLLSLYVNEGLG
uniref:ATP synthase subunit a n=1 Tax=Halocynthia roretzi TaxID=7729 RepID=Q9T9G9_HALRO|nr:ATP synthase F0 subunit 6 [Halocynthia roretzi]BAA88261.1 ATP synthase subunit 6 [Halocynthia roretzi]